MRYLIILCDFETPNRCVVVTAKVTARTRLRTSVFCGLKGKETQNSIWTAVTQSFRRVFSPRWPCEQQLREQTR